MSFSYARRENSSFVHAAPETYIRCMKNRYPTAQELYALEQEARRLRAMEMARLFRAGAAAVRRFFAPQPVKGLRHA